MIETTHPNLSIRRQRDLVGLNRVTFYHQPTGETALNLALMRVSEQPIGTCDNCITRFVKSATDNNVHIGPYFVKRQRVIGMQH